MNSSLDTICQQISQGRQLARQLTLVLRGQSLNEVDFRVLWLLSRQGSMRLEQRGIAEQLGVSPAQVSTLVEKLRRQNLIDPHINDGDPRRQHWQLTSLGRERFGAAVAIVEHFLTLQPHSQQEEAA